MPYSAQAAGRITRKKRLQGSDFIDVCCGKAAARASKSGKLPYNTQPQFGRCPRMVRIDGLFG